jgi:hypothetical protein
MVFLLEIVGKVQTLGFDSGQLTGLKGEDSKDKTQRTRLFKRGVVASFNFRHLS